MATKTIKANVTIGVAGEMSTRGTVDAMGNVIEIPHLDTVYVPPGTPVTLDAAEADAILARFGGEEVAPPAAPAPAADPKAKK